MCAGEACSLAGRGRCGRALKVRFGRTVSVRGSVGICLSGTALGAARRVWLVVVEERTMHGCWWCVSAQRRWRRCRSHCCGAVLRFGGSGTRGGSEVTSSFSDEFTGPD